MDPDGGSPSEGRFETFDANDRFVVVRDELGYGVWRLEDLEDGEPVERFADDDEGYEAAAARWKVLTKAEHRSRVSWMKRLKIAVIVSAVFWGVSALLINLQFLLSTLGHPFRAFPTHGLEMWISTIALASSQVTEALLAIYLVIWLDARWRR